MNIDYSELKFEEIKFQNDRTKKYDTINEDLV